MSGGGGTTTSNTSTTIPKQVLQEYTNVTNQANQVAATPLQQYQGQIVADFTPQQTAAFNAVNNMQGITAPYTASATNFLNQSGQTIDPNRVSAADIQQYMNPYTSNVLNATIAAENNQDAMQQAQLQGNAISAGAWGGDRSGVAQGILGGQQAIANNATNSGILAQGYAQALQEANAQQQAALNAQEASQYLQANAGLGMNQLGLSAQQADLTGINALLGAGQLQQQQAQSLLNVPYEQFLQRQAYPFQTTGWLANIAEGIGSNEGGTSTSSTTQPAGGLFGGLFHRGGGITGRRARGGIVRRRDIGGSMPFDTSDYSKMDPQDLVRLSKGIQQDSPEARAIQAALLVKEIMPDMYNLTSMRRGGIVPQRFTFGGDVLPIVGDIIGSIYGDPFAGNQAQAVIKKFPFKKGGIVPHLADGGDSADDIFNPPEPVNVAYAPSSHLDDQFSMGVTGADIPNFSGIASNLESAPPPTPPINAPDHPDNSGYMTQFPTTHEPSMARAIAAGVLGTLAGRSRNPLVDIGQGGLIGIKNYEEQVQEAEKQNYTEGSFRQNAQKLMDEAENARGRLAEEKLRDANTSEYQKGVLDLHAKELELGKSEITKDIFGNPIALVNKVTGKTIPLNVNPDGTNNPNRITDVDGKTPLTIPQQQAYKGLLKSQMPKDIAAQNVVIPSLVDQKEKVDDLANKIPIASHGDLHTLQDFADRNQLPIFSDPKRAAATVEQNYDSLGNVLDNIRSTFQGTGRVLAKEFDALQNELSVNKSASPEQKAIVVGHIQSRLSRMIEDETQRTKDIQNGTAYLPSYQSPELRRLTKVNSSVGNNQSGAPAQTGSSSIIRYDASGRRIQ